MFKPGDLFDLRETEHALLFEKCLHAWEVLKQIESYLSTHLRPALHHQAEGPVFIGEHVFIGRGTIVEPGASIKGPAIIGRNCQIRHNAYVRENVVIGDNCVVGNSCEIKNSILFNHATVPHFNYVGDSVLGCRAHLGAGAVISNLKLTPGSIVIEYEGRRWDTGLRKFGALLGDNADIGCNAVLNPGSIIGRGSAIYPNANWRGVLPPNRIVKNRAPVEVIERRTG